MNRLEPALTSEATSKETYRVPPWARVSLWRAGTGLSCQPFTACSEGGCGHSTSWKGSWGLCAQVLPLALTLWDSPCCRVSQSWTLTGVSCGTPRARCRVPVPLPAAHTGAARSPAAAAAAAAAPGGPAARTGVPTSGRAPGAAEPGAGYRCLVPGGAPRAGGWGKLLVPGGWGCPGAAAGASGTPKCLENPQNTQCLKNPPK